VHPLFLSEAVEFAGSHNALSRSKAPKHGHCRGKTSSIGADRGDDGIWIYGLAGSSIIFKNMQMASGYLMCFSRVKLVIIGQTASAGSSASIWSTMAVLSSRQAGAGETRVCALAY
jgi:hypothetical protein